MNSKAVSIRLHSEGGPEIKRLFDDVAASGDASAQRLARSFARADQDMTAAAQRRSNALAKINAIMPQTAMQMRVDGSVASGFGQYEGSARRSAVAFRELIAEQEKLEERTRRMVASIDPAVAAQDRFNAEMAEARSLVSAGTLTLDQYVKKLGQERAALAAATDAHGSVATSSNAMRSAMTGASFQVQDMITQISMGANPINAMTVQGMQMAGGFAYVEGKAGSLARFLIGPWGLAISGGLLLIGALTKGLLSSADAADKKGDAAKDLTTRLEELKEATDRQTQSEQATAAASLVAAQRLREEAVAARAATIEKIKYARAAVAANLAQANRFDGRGDGGGAAAGGSGAAAAMGLSELQRLDGELAQREKDLANSEVQVRAAQVPILRQQIAEATDRAAAATGRYDRAMDQLNRRFGAGRVSQADYLREATALQQQRDRSVEAAQEVERRERGGGRRRNEAAEAAENTRAQLALARAYLVGGSAAASALVPRHELAETVAGEIADGAKTLEQLREETAARAAARAQVLAGTMAMGEMDQALQDEAALRPLIKLQLIAQGEAQAVLTRLIDGTRAAMAAAREEDGKLGATRAIEEAIARTRELEARLADLSLPEPAQAANAAARAANRQADQLRLPQNSDERARLVASAVGEAGANANLSRAGFARQVLTGQRESIEMAEAELRLLTSTDRVREGTLAKLRLAFDLRRNNIVLESEVGKQALRNQDRLSEIVDRLNEQARAWETIRGFGSAFVDEVLSPETWDNWGEGGKRILGMLQAEMVKLAILNPLKNLLFGGTEATIGSVFGFLTGKGSNSSLPGKVIPGKAAGTDYFSGGAMLVGELGPEILHAPRGARVTTAADTRRMLAPASVHGGTSITIHADRAVLADEVRGWVNEGMQMAAAQGAAGGAQISEVSMSTRGRRRLGRGW